MDVMNLNDLNGYTVKSCYFALDVYTKYRFDGPIFQGKGGGGDLSKYKNFYINVHQHPLLF